MTVLAATGDQGATDYSNAAGTLLYTHRAVVWPASDPLVTAVGGTQLALYDNGQRTAPDAVWNDGNNYALLNAFDGSPDPTGIAGGGGKSTVFGRPSYQNGVASVVGNHRGIPDISMSAACSGLVLTYNSFGGEQTGWYVDVRHQRGDPAVRRDRGAGRPGGRAFPRPDQPGAVRPVRPSTRPGWSTSPRGTTRCRSPRTAPVYTVKGYSAGRGYDLASGVGTVNADLFVPELAQAAGG